MFQKILYCFFSSVSSSACYVAYSLKSGTSTMQIPCYASYVSVMARYLFLATDQNPSSNRRFDTLTDYDKRQEIRFTIKQ